MVEFTEAEQAARRAARKDARQALVSAGFSGNGRWLTLNAGGLATFEAKARTDGKVQLFMVRDGRRFVGTVAPSLLMLTVNLALKGGG